MPDKVSESLLEDVRCVPLCGASKSYGRFDQPWKHEPECPVRLAWESEKKAWDDENPVETYA